MQELMNIYCENLRADGCSADEPFTIRPLRRYESRRRCMSIEQYQIVKNGKIDSFTYETKRDSMCCRASCFIPSHTTFKQMRSLIITKECAARNLVILRKFTILREFILQDIAIHIISFVAILQPHSYFTSLKS